MLTRRKDKPDLDPDDELIGKCGTCHCALSILASQATRPPSVRLVGKDPGTWNDLTYADCPQCHARVYLVAKKRL